MEPNNKKNPLETKSKIISILKIKGPSLPVHIAKQTGLDMLFASAFLSELAREKEVRISSLKVGGSPLYFIQGQEAKLENFYNYLPEKEREAFSLIKKKKFLEDRKQEPAIRMALRSIKDFAFPLVIDRGQGQELFWRFYNISEEEAKSKFQLKPKVEVKTEQKKLTGEEEKPVLELKPKIPVKIKKPKEKPDFSKKIISLLISGNIELIEEREIKKRDFESIIRIDSQLGKIKLLCIAKDKKMITENDLRIATQKSQTAKMPVLFLSTGNLNKKAISYLEQYSGTIIFKKIKE